MQQLIEFSLRHWELCLAFLAILGFLLAFEVHIKMSGAAPLSPQQAIFLMNREQAIMLDIRDVDSFTKEHIAASVNIPFSELPQKINQLNANLERPIIINYSQGQPYHRIPRMLKNAGFSKIYHLKGGIMHWRNAGFPLIKK